MKVLLAEDRPPEGPGLRSLLESLGHQVVGPAAARRGEVELVVLALHAGVEAAAEIARVRPVPMVMVVPGRDPAEVGRALEVPVFAYLVEPVSADTLAPALRLARARFVELSALRAELVEVHRQLAERKTVERAKGILMQVRGLSEGEAYRLLRRESQNRRRSLREVANSVVQMEAGFRASAGEQG
jgi:AmiR/NasT family two-component response regulator